MLSKYVFLKRSSPDLESSGDCLECPAGFKCSTPKLTVPQACDVGEFHKDVQYKSRIEVQVVYRKY